MKYVKASIFFLLISISLMGCRCPTCYQPNVGRVQKFATNKVTTKDDYYATYYSSENMD